MSVEQQSAPDIQREAAARAERPRVLVADPIAPEGVGYLRRFADVDERHGLGAEGLAAAIDAYDALVVRSEPKVTAAALPAAPRPRAVARAGVRGDNLY